MTRKESNEVPGFNTAEDSNDRLVRRDQVTLPKIHASGISSDGLKLPLKSQVRLTASVTSPKRLAYIPEGISLRTASKGSGKRMEFASKSGLV